MGRGIIMELHDKKISELFNKPTLYARTVVNETLKQWAIAVVKEIYSITVMGDCYDEKNWERIKKLLPDYSCVGCGEGEGECNKNTVAKFLIDRFEITEAELK